MATAASAQTPEFSWRQSLPVKWGEPAVTPIGGTEIRALVPFHGQLFAGNGYWTDTSQTDPALPGAQVLRLDSPSGKWTVDLQLDERTPAGLRMYLAIAVLAKVHLATDKESKPLPAPVDMLLAGVWKRGRGLDLFSRTTEAKAWTKATLPGQEDAARGAQIRAFAQHRDTVSGVDTVFAGATKSIFAGVYDRGRNTIAWNPAAEWTAEGGSDPDGSKGRVASFADCGGKLYAGAFDTVYERVDGAKPDWKRVFAVTVHAQSNRVTGLRGLTCIRNAAGKPALLAGVEDNPTGVYRVDLQAKDATGLYPGVFEVDVSALLSKTLGVRATYGIVAYNDMTPDAADSKNCTQYLMGVEANAPQDPAALNGHLAGAYYVIRDCAGKYTVHEVVDKQASPKPPLEAVRTIALSPFPADPAGTVYAGGFDCARNPSHNTAWLYRGTVGVAK